MRLIKAEFKNFCQHRDLSVDFAPNLNAILGPNGAGKTNLLNGLYFALTGDMRGYGVNSDNICQLAAADEHSYVKLSFEHGGAKAEVKRGLNPNHSSLRLQGEDKEYNKTGDINKKIEELIGLPKRILSDFIFIEQTKISAFLSMRPSDRAIALQRLFGTQQCEKAWVAIGEHMKRIVIPTPKIDIEAVNKRIEACRLRLSYLRSALEACPIYDDWSLRTDPDFLLKNQWDKRQELEQELLELKEQLASSRYHLQETELVQKTQTENLDRVIKQLEAIDTTAAQNIVHQWDFYHKMTGTRQRLEDDIDELEAEPAKNPKPGNPPDDYLDEEALLKFFGDTRELEVELHNLKNFIRTVDKGANTAVCPSCATVFPAEEVENKQAKADEMAETVAARKDRMHRSKDYAESVKAYKTWAVNYKRRTMDVAARMEELSGVINPPTTTLEDAKEEIQKASQLTQQQKTLLAKLKIAESSCSGAKMRAEMLAKSVEEKEAQQAAFRLPKGDIKKLLAEASRRLDAKEQAYKERIRINAEVQSLAVALEADEKAALEASKVLLKAEKYKEWINTLDGTRAVLHKDALPKLVSQRYLMALEGEINTILTELNAPFRIQTGDDLSFVAEFANGSTHRAERLSVGQQSILSLALRIVVNATFAGDTGLLALDEPTEGLDADNLHGLEIALRRLQTLSKDRGLQCLLVTHENALEPLFDNVLMLSAPV